MKSDDLRIALALAEEFEAGEAANRELAEALQEHASLLEASRLAVHDIQDLLLYSYPSNTPWRLLAKYRKELAELVGTYGCKIVLVGDKTLGTVVLK